MDGSSNETAQSPDVAPHAEAPRAKGWRRLFAREHRNTAIYFGVSILSKAASVLLIPLYTKRLSPSEYAIYGLCQTLYWLGPPLFTLSLSAAFGRFFFDDSDPVRRDRLVGKIATPILAMAICASLAAEAIFAVFPSLHLGVLDPRLLRIVVWTCAAIAMGELPSVYFRERESAWHFAVLNLAVFALTIGSTLYLMLGRGMGVEGLLYGMLIGQGAGAAFAIYQTVTHLGVSFDKEVIRSAIRYSVPFIPHMVAGSFIVGIDRWALETYGFHEELGLYTLAIQLAAPVQLATQAWNGAASPTFLAAWRDGGDDAARRKLPRIVLGFIVTGFGALVIVFLAMPLLPYVIGKKFTGGIGLVPWVGASQVVGSLYAAYINVLFLRKTTRVIPFVTVASLAVSVVLNVLLVPRFGVMGAIAGTGGGVLFRTLVMYRFAKRALAAPSEG